MGSFKSCIIWSLSSMKTFQSVRSLVGSTKSASYLSSGLCTLVNSTTTASPVGQHLIQVVRKKFNLASMSYAPYLVSFFVVLLSSGPSGCECYRFRTDHCVLDHRSSPHANVHRKLYIYSTCLFSTNCLLGTQITEISDRIQIL